MSAGAGGTNLAYGHSGSHHGSKDVVYGKVSESPTTPIKTIEKVDDRLLKKLSLLEHNTNKQRMEEYVSDLWSVMADGANSGG